MRILMLAPVLGLRGPMPKYIPVLRDALEKLGCTVTLMPWGKRRENESVARKAVDRGRDIVRVRRELQRVAYDILLVHTAHDWATLAREIPLLLATRRWCPNLVLHLHGGDPDQLVGRGRVPFKLASALMVHLADAVMVLSTEEQAQWQAFHPTGRFVTVRNPFVPTPEAAKLPTRGELGLPEDAPVLLFVGRIIERKGIRELIDAFADVAKQTPSHLHVVGEGALVGEVERRIAAMGLAGRVTLSGYLEGEALNAALRRADVFVLPSWTEGFPVALTEAMAVGLPVVTTKIRGMRDHLRDGVHALFVEPRDAKGLGAQLLRLLRDPELRARMGTNNQRKIEEFAPDIVARDYLDVLRSITRNTESGRCPGADASDQGLRTDTPGRRSSG